ncbi:MAG: molybdopterin-dependent oxidoreductase [Chloroflexota bacterium]|nr:molybdopterin-dependent oxidoreductase [Chloroflexota bacterium]
MTATTTRQSRHTLGIPALAWSERMLARRAVRAGGLAALLMLVVQLGWRLGWASPGVPSLPEIIVAAVSRLTPLGVFGFATENFGSLAQNTLFVAVLIGVVAVGSELGGLAEQIKRRIAGGDLLARVAAGLIAAIAALIVVGLVILPIANLGVFARDSSSARELMTQLLISFAIFGIAWGLLSTPHPAATEVGAEGGEDVSRRYVLERSVWGLGTIGLVGAVGTLTWRLIRPRPLGNVAESERAAEEIAAAARQRAAGPSAAPTSAPIPPLVAAPNPPAAGVAGTADSDAPVAADASDAATVAPDAVASDTFANLEADGSLTPLITSVADFYHVSKNIMDPEVDGDDWSLTIDGLVNQPLKLSYEEVVQRATVRKITTLCCISNELGGDLIGTAEWQGFPLAELLAEAGVQENAVDLKFRCADDYEDSIPVAQGMDPDTLVVVGMNGEPLAPDHGYPARLIVPGIYGMKNVKWVQRIEVVDEDFKGYWQTRGWSDPAPYQIWGRIDLPGSGDEIPVGPAVAAGVASAGDRDVQRVEVSLDDGETWADATLEAPLNPPLTWVRWLFPFDAAAGEHKLLIRVTDGTGEVAPRQRNPPLPSGATGWPSRTVRVAD